MFAIYRSSHLISKIFDASTSERINKMLSNILELSSAFDGRPCDFDPAQRKTETLDSFW